MTDILSLEPNVVWISHDVLKLYLVVLAYSHFLFHDVGIHFITLCIFCFKLDPCQDWELHCNDDVQLLKLFHLLGWNFDKACLPESCLLV